MKRYELAEVGSDWNPWREMREATDGEWVRAEEAEAEIAEAELQHTEGCGELAKLRAVVDTLPKCEHTRCKQSPKLATWLTFDGWLCDEHESTAPEYQRQQLPYADALRALEST